MKKTIGLNIFFMVAVLGALVWHHTQSSDKATVIKTDAQPNSPTTEEPKALTPSPVSSTEPNMSTGGETFPERTAPPPKRELPPEVAAKYQALIKSKIPDKLTSMIPLFIEQRLEMAPDKGININPADTPTATAFDLTWRDGGKEYKMHVEINKVEASYTKEHYMYPYSLALMVDEKVMVQFTGLMNLNYEMPTFEDMQINEYQSGDWEKDIKRLTLTN
jgi:hypothetical protein